MWKIVAVLAVVSLLPVSAVAHTKLFYRMSYRSDYRKVEVTVVTPEPTVTAETTEILTEAPTVEPTETQNITPLVEIPLESTLTPEPTLTPIPTEVLTTTPSVEIMDTEDAVDTTDQITTLTDIATTPPEEVF